MIRRPPVLFNLGRGFIGCRHSAGAATPVGTRRAVPTTAGAMHIGPEETPATRGPGSLHPTPDTVRDGRVAQGQGGAPRDILRAKSLNAHEAGYGKTNGRTSAEDQPRRLILGGAR